MSDLLPSGLRDTAKWIQARDPNATNYLYCLQAAEEIERLREVLGRIADASRSEGGCYYTNLLNIDRAREALKAKASPAS